MPPRFAYWTIILDGTPTSFRTKEREEILPLFNQLKAKNPMALLKWFSGGTLWDSPEQAREAREREKVRAFRDERSREAKAQREGTEDPLAEFRKRHGRPADGSDQQRPDVPGRGPGFPPRREGRPPSDRRGKDWRPGGEHRDPADKYKLPPGEARKRWKERNLGPRAAKPFGDRKPFGSKPPGDRPWSDKRGGPPSTRGGNDRSLRPGKPFGDRKPFGSKPFGSKPGGRPFGGKPRGRGKPPGGPRGKR